MKCRIHLFGFVEGHCAHIGFCGFFAYFEYLLAHIVGVLVRLVSILLIQFSNWRLINRILNPIRINLPLFILLNNIHFIRRRRLSLHSALIALRHLKCSIRFVGQSLQTTLSLMIHKLISREPVLPIEGPKPATPGYHLNIRILIV